MPRPTTRDELLAAAADRYEALLTLIDRLPGRALDAEFGFKDRDRNVRDVLGHLHEWHLMMLDWYSAGWRVDAPPSRRPATPGRPFVRSRRGARALVGLRCGR